MSFDPGLNYPPHGGLAGPSGSISSPTYSSAPTSADAPAAASTYPKIISIGGGYSVIYLNEQDEMMGGKIVADKEISAGTGGGGAATQGQLLSNQMDQQKLAQDSELFYQNMGYEKAKFNIQQQAQQAEAALAQANNTRDYAAAQHWNQVAQDLKQQQFQLDQNAQQFSQYKSLADLASNPRNFVQTFFMNRGQTPPPDVAKYGNTNMNASQIMPFQQFQQRMTGAAGGGVAAAPSAPTYSNPVVSQTGAQYPQGTQLSPSGTGVYGSSYQGLSGFDAATGKPRLSPTDPDAAGLMAKNPGMYAMTSPEEVMKYLPQKQPTMYARGGKLRMMGPHAVINLMTGKTVAIAGEQGPENAYFDGAAIIDPNMETDPYGGLSQYMPGYEPGAQVGVESTQTQQTGSQYLPGSEPTPYDVPTIPTQSWTQTDLAAMIAAANAGNTQTSGMTGGTTYESTPYTNYQQPITAQPAATTTTQGPIIDYNYEPTPTPEAPPVIQNSLAAVTPQSAIAQPGAVPQSNYQTGETSYSPMSPVSNITPASVAPAGTFGQPIASKMPTYLGGENFQAASPVTEAVRNLPFMQRVWAQGRGDPTQGTNTPQRTDLPPDLPLISSMAWQQLAPSEQQAFLSYVSSLGISPEDYLAMIQQNSPTGGASYQPLFGNQTPYARQ